MFIAQIAHLPRIIKISHKNSATENLPRCLICNMNAFLAEPQKPDYPEIAMNAKADLLI
jgi:hypothetical protein